MHELGIAREIWRAIGGHAGGRRVKAVTIEVGALAGVAADALDFCIVEAAKDMGFGEPRVTIRQVDAVLKCTCGEEYFTSDLLDGCPSCGGFEREILSGLDLAIREVEFEEESGGETEERG